MFRIIVFAGFLIYSVVMGITQGSDYIMQLFIPSVVLQLLFDLPYIFRERNRTGTFLGQIFLLIPKFGVQLGIGAAIGNMLKFSAVGAFGAVWGLIKSIVIYARKKRDEKIFGHHNEPSAIKEISDYQEEFLEEEALKRKIRRIMDDDDYY
ncbi:MAG: hypothetical protein ACI4SK_06750 [Christensenellales bacterium]